MGEPSADVRRPEGGQGESDAGLMLRPQRRRGRRPLKLLLVVHVEGSPLMRLVIERITLYFTPLNTAAKQYTE
jgi:hypothetical protein